MDNKPLILFDLVSTLTQAGPRYVQAYIRMCQAWGAPVPAADDIMQALGEKNLRQIVAEFTPDLPVEYIPKFMSDCNQACDAMLQDKSWEEDLYPQAREALQDLRAAGYVLGIYTGTRENALRAQMDYHGLHGLFDPAFLRAKDNERDGDIPNHKLKTAQIAALCAAHGGNGPVVIVGDSASDYEAARETGVLFIGFAANPQAAQKMRDAGVMHIFSDYAHLPAIAARVVAAATPQRMPPAPSGRNKPSPPPAV